MFLNSCPENIHKLKLKVAELETEKKKILFITNENHLRQKTELENVILKQEEIKMQKEKNKLNMIIKRNKLIEQDKADLKNMTIISIHCLIAVFFYLSFIYGYSLFAFIFRVVTTDYNFSIQVVILLLRINELIFIYFFSKLTADIQ